MEYDGAKCSHFMTLHPPMHFPFNLLWLNIFVPWTTTNLSRFHLCNSSFKPLYFLFPLHHYCKSLMKSTPHDNENALTINQNVQNTIQLVFFDIGKLSDYFLLAGHELGIACYWLVDYNDLPKCNIHMLTHCILSHIYYCFTFIVYWLRKGLFPNTRGHFRWGAPLPGSNQIEQYSSMRAINWTHDL